MQYYHRNKNQFWKPVVNLDKLRHSEAILRWKGTRDGRRKGALNLFGEMIKSNIKALRVEQIKQLIEYCDFVFAV